MINQNTLNSTPTNPNDTAFPAQFEDSFFTEGLTKREYFAAMAMQGFLASGTEGNTLDVAQCSIAYADALIKAFSK